MGAMLNVAQELLVAPPDFTVWRTFSYWRENSLRGRVAPVAPEPSLAPGASGVIKGGFGSNSTWNFFFSYEGQIVSNI